MANTTIDICPICGSTLFEPFLVCKDFTTSHEKFQLQRCLQCSFLLTNPQPDDQSLAKYYESDTYISHTGKSSAFFDSVYLVARRFTLRWKTKLIRQYQSKSQISILDYGCGTGEFLQACTRLGWKSHGVEPSEPAQTKAIALTNLNIKKNLSEIEGEKFDVITLWHVLEHVPDFNTKLSELRQLLNENGILFVAVPNHQAYDALVFSEYWAGYDVPRHLWHFSKLTMQRLFANKGFKLKAVKPMKLDAFYVSILSQKYKSGASTIGGIFGALMTAFISNYKAKRTTEYSSLIYIATQ